MDIAVDQSGNIYVLGNSFVSGSGRDFVTVKYNAQGTEEWRVRFDEGQQHYETPSALALDNLGNVYVTGGSWPNLSISDYLTVKYNSNGSMMWKARYNGPDNGNDRSTNLIVDNSGNVYVTGLSHSGSSQADYTTVKYNSKGKEQWVARYNGSANSIDRATHIATDRSGNIFVTGWSLGYYPYEGTTSKKGIVTVKYNKNGVQQWVTRYDAQPLGSEAEPVRLVTDDLGNVYILGSSDVLDGRPDYLTIKYNNMGEEQWTALFDGPGDPWGKSRDEPAALAVDDSGNVYITGTSRAHVTGRDYATVKYSSSGVKLWAARYNGSQNSSDQAAALALDALGNVYVTGSRSLGERHQQTVTVKYNAAGAEQWAAPFLEQVAPRNYAQSITVDNAGHVFVTGSLYSGYSSVVTTIKYSQGASLLVSIEDEKKNLPQAYHLAQNYPNPFSQRIADNSYTTIGYALPQTAYVTITIYDLLGKKVARLVNDIRTAGKYETHWQPVGLSNGVYFYHLEIGKHSRRITVATKKLILLK